MLQPFSERADVHADRALERLGFSGQGTIGFSAQGFRATAATIFNEPDIRTDVINRQLSHQERNCVRAAYNQAEYLEDRRAMMQQWAGMFDALAQGRRATPIRKTAA